LDRRKAQERRRPASMIGKNCPAMQFLPAQRRLRQPSYS
jgi:hypothetical protein